ncbi:MAG: flagellar motor switch protein FliM, partial [Planctomycetota bacterium]
MPDQFLDHSQMESLLRAMELSAGPPPQPNTQPTAQPAAVPPGPSAVPALPAGALDTPAVAYDFKRPERVGKEQMRAMHSLHETLARNFGAAVSSMLRTVVEVKLAGVDQLTYSEFIFGLENPSCFNVMRTQQLEGNWILDISPQLACVVIDRMLGGDPQPGDTIHRPLTAIENRLISRVVDAFNEQLRAAWQNITTLDLVVDRTESNPHLVQVVPPNEVIVLVAMDVVMGRNRGSMSLCIPYNTIESFSSLLASNGWVGYSKSTSDATTRKQISDSVDTADVNLVVTLAGSRIRAGDLLGLAVGDIITTEHDAQLPMQLSIQGVPKFSVHPG